jgi:hypothetical protein
MSRLKDSLLKFAREQYNAREEEEGSLASISPTPFELIDIIIQDLENMICDGCYICDIGCGDGRWLYSFAMKHQSLCIGLEICDERIRVAKRSSNSYSNMKGIIEFIKGNFLIHSLNLQLMDIIIVYLSRKGNESIKNKIEKECKKGTIIIAIGFTMLNWVYDKKYDQMHIPAYIYTIK